MMDGFDLDPARMRPFTDGRHRSTFLLLGLTALASLIAGAAASGAGLGVIAVGLLTATAADFLRWRDEEIAAGGLTFDRVREAEPAPVQRALPPPAVPLPLDRPLVDDAPMAESVAPAEKTRSRVFPANET